ncbi:MAG: DUF86 domain-containing protein [Candidatus Kapaibacterium sp.]|jgi:uncharacterized protein with HEPN domain
MRDRIGDKARLQHILDAISEIEDYIDDVDFQDFETNSMMRNASIRQLEIIGEASSRLSKELKLENPTVNWKDIIGFRNIIIHQYFGIDEKIVWDILKNDLQLLKKQIGKICK